MKNSAVARRYAKALMLIGKEDGQAENYRDELNGMAQLMEKEHTLRQAVYNPIYANESRRKILEAIIGKLKLTPVMKSFLLLLFDKGRINFISLINQNYQKLADELKGVARASVTSAAMLSTEAVEKIRLSLSKMVGKEIILECKQDASLIGGVVTQIGDLILDGSIKTQLFNMKESLKRGESV
ncbi:MAG: ATP synthase F1 subunit delta [Thermodesulfobacteriota bacterium]